MEIKKENVLKAHRVCPVDQEKLLENLFPEVFEKKYEVRNGLKYRFSNGEEYMVLATEKTKNEFMLVDCDLSGNTYRAQSQENIRERLKEHGAKLMKQ